MATESKSAAVKRQEASKAQQEEQAEKTAVPPRAKGDTLTAVLRDEADSTVDAVTRSVSVLGGYVKSAKGNKVTVDLPPESERNPDSQRQKIAFGLLANPLVESLE
jgi:phosphoribosylformylglycinamidine (FGAM) synthase PurS component